MAHKLLSEDIVEHSKKKKGSNRIVEGLGGKFGVSIFIGSKEFFIGVSVSEVEIEKVIRRKTVKTKKSKVQVLQFD